MQIDPQHINIEPSEVLVSVEADSPSAVDAVIVQVGDDVGSFEVGEHVELFGCSCIDPDWRSWDDTAHHIVCVPLAEYNLFPLHS